MAWRVGRKLLLPIGCSCIVQFQLDRSTILAAIAGSTPPFTVAKEAWLFDWQITKPDTTVDILSSAALGIGGIEDFDLHECMVRSKRFAGLYFWHICKDLGKPGLRIDHLDELRPEEDRIIGKYDHLFKKLRTREDEIHCIWSNVQPNLQIAAEMVREPWDDFVLTKERYEKIVTAARNLDADVVRNWFVCRREDIDPDLIGAEGVFLVDLPRSTDYKGEVDLFRDVVTACLGTDAADGEGGLPVSG